jgi:hypothetical protein
MTELEQLGDVLGRERVLLDVLVYRLVALRALLVAGEGRYLAWAAEEVADATAAVRAAEVQRAMLVSELAERQGLADDALPLSVLVETAPAPWHAILDDHRRALAALAGEVDDHASAVRRLARTTGEAVRSLLADLVAEHDATRHEAVSS